MLKSQLDSGFVIGTWVFASILGIFLTTFAISFRAWRKTTEEMSNSALIALISGTLTVLIAVVALLALWPPFALQYHTFVPYTGQVKAVQSRFIADGQGGTSQFFPVEFVNGDVRRCDDSRCALLHKGQVVTLLCERTFQFNAQEGWNCNWGKMGGNR